MIRLEKISREETLRYLGNTSVSMNETMDALLNSCEAEILRAANVKYLYKKIPLNNNLLAGNDIKNHLRGCDEAVVLCATLGAGVDRLIRTAQVVDMARAVVLDAMASAAVEQVCSGIDELIAAGNPEKFTTWRFSPGYGDYPVELQKTVLSILDAPRKIGLCTNDSSLLTPMKSVTAIVGLSVSPVESKRRGCTSCNLRKTCKFRKAGTRCDF